MSSYILKNESWSTRFHKNTLIKSEEDNFDKPNLIDSNYTFNPYNFSEPPEYFGYNLIANILM
jgi:hypothetical protein